MGSLKLDAFQAKSAFQAATEPGWAFARFCFVKL
jgi:hypothetical protein